MFELMRALSIDDQAAAATGQAWVAADHPLFRDHFPGQPTLPGTLAVELAAQVAGALAEDLVIRLHGRERCAFLGMIQHAKFLRPVTLPARLDFTARLRHDAAAGMEFDVSAAIEEGALLRARLFMALADPPADWQPGIRIRKERVARLRGAQPTP